ncbi:MAG: GNAT family N-acetyltransferase [Clostridiales bacterium]|jgi:GNAT superfamily N-acetyltransferase|nr:GNAT family N-acetyltransferase [Clostridiales bacterium]
MADLLVKLYDLDLTAPESALRGQGIYVKKACIVDKPLILDFVSRNFGGTENHWISECEYALFNNPTSCYIAVNNREIIGFACYDATAKGFFGPTGVRRDQRGKGIGKALLLKSLASMKEYGYAYAVIGWIAEDARDFYINQTGAVEIPDSPPEKSIYRNMAMFE